MQEKTTCKIYLPMKIHSFQIPEMPLWSYQRIITPVPQDSAELARLLHVLIAAYGTLAIDCEIPHTDTFALLVCIVPRRGKRLVHLLFPEPTDSGPHSPRGLRAGLRGRLISPRTTCDI